MLVTRTADDEEAAVAQTDGRDDVPWLGPEQLDDWHDLAAVMIRLPSALESQLQKDADLSQFEYFVMAHLSESPGREARMSELAMMANGSLSRLSHVVSRLERRGYFVRRQSPDDGFAKLADSAPGHVRRVRELVVDALTPEQLEALGAACRVVLERIDAVDGTTFLQRPQRLGPGR